MPFPIVWVRSEACVNGIVNWIRNVQERIERIGETNAIELKCECDLGSYIFSLSAWERAQSLNRMALKIESSNGVRIHCSSVPRNWMESERNEWNWIKMWIRILSGPRISNIWVRMGLESVRRSNCGLSSRSIMWMRVPKNGCESKNQRMGLH